MEQKSNLSPAAALIVSIVVTLILTGCSLLLGGTAETAVTTAQQDAITTSVVNVLKPLLPKSGAVASPELGPWFSVGGIVHDGLSSTSFVTATSTVCAFQSPAATSTLVSATLQIGTVPYKNEWDIYKAANIATKTTLLAHGNDLQNGSIVATSTLISVNDGIFAPNQWVNFSFATTTAVNGSFAAVASGRCSVIFREL